MSTFNYKGAKFYLDGKEFKILSGSIHYFRVHPDLWEDRLLKLRAMGLNTVETYVCWNLHEKKEGEFDFSGILDIERFIKIADTLGLKVIVRPGPYICAEWDFGGFPSWLLKYKTMKIRCGDELFVSKLYNYLKVLFEHLKPYLISKGGPVIMMQVENEYGSYGNDTEYIENLADFYVKCGIDCQLFTADGSYDTCFSGGVSDKLLATCNMFNDAKRVKSCVEKHQKNKPFMVTEFWTGKHDKWGDEHCNLPTNVPENFKEILDLDGNINMYMFHGGTSFGFTRGANTVGGKYLPDVSSYDFGAPLSEAGDITDNYLAIRKIIEDKFGKIPYEIPANSKKKAYGTVKFDKCAGLFENLDRLSKPVHSRFPMTMEDLDQNFGYVLYKTTFDKIFEYAPIELKVHDRAEVYLDGKYAGQVDRNGNNNTIAFATSEGHPVQFTALVENQGRINFGNQIWDPKGLLDAVERDTLGIKPKHFGYENYSLPMDNLENLVYTEAKLPKSHIPTFFKGTLNVDEPCDTFISLPGFTKGFVTVNGFNIGCYNNPKGPQQTLYIPSPILKKGENEIVVFESDGTTSLEAKLLDSPIIG